MHPPHSVASRPVFFSACTPQSCRLLSPHVPRLPGRPRRELVALCRPSDRQRARAGPLLARAVPRRRRAGGGEGVPPGPLHPAAPGSSRPRAACPTFLPGGGGLDPFPPSPHLWEGPGNGAVARLRYHRGHPGASLRCPLYIGRAHRADRIRYGRLRRGDGRRARAAAVVRHHRPEPLRPTSRQ